MDKNLLDVYSDYLLSSFGRTTATGLSTLLDGQISHDQVTRFLSGEAYTSKTLWQQIKPMLRSIERDEGVLIFDDTIQAKPHTDENELICWHFDHTQNRSVKGVNLLNCVYQIDDLTIPVAFELVRKPLLFSDPETGQTKRKSEVVVSTLECTFSVYGLSSVKTSFGDRNSRAFLGRLLSRFSARRISA
jgi:hypothetical protein